MSSHVTVDRLQFTLTVTFHYLFPILTMGLALFVAWLKTVSYLGREQHRLAPLRKTDAQRRTYDGAAQFFATIFAVTFAVGVVTGIPLEFQFGTNWAAFSNYAGGVIGQTLAMEGVFAFFAESAFIGVFLAGRGRVGERLHWIAALMLLAGSWTSGFFIIATNAWMQHPVAYTLHHGRAQLNSLWELLTNPWLPWQYAHNMSGAAVTGAFVIAGLGAFYRLLGRHPEFSRVCLSVGVVGALIFSTLQVFPTGDRHARMVARYQPSSFAAMEALFRSEKGAPLVIIGNPDTEHRTLDSAIEMPHALSFLTSQRWDTQLRGLDDIPIDRWPDSVPLVYYAYHIMVGLGTILLAVAVLAALLLRRGRLLWSRPMLWALMLAVPFTFIANIAGWTVAETGRQPWIAFGLMRTPAGASPASAVPAGAGLFTLLGFAGLYLLIGIVYVLLIVRIVGRGPREGTIAPVAPAAMTAA
ncbi:MAG TPA: cytochrome ubiquinol oxidase subunit I [Solirubrobacteraceae bacterium]|nr:cytochrome ubiquinol oxidase subunit I [Solirubrobacteraceae bacterium]